MRNMHIVLVAAVAISPALAQMPAGTAPAAANVKAVQPGLFDVAGPKINEAVTVGIQKVVATPGKGGRSVVVQSPWGYSYFGWPKNLKPVAFTIDTGKPGGATINAPGFKDANKADYKAAIETILQHAITTTRQNRAFAEGFR